MDISKISQSISGQRLYQKGSIETASQYMKSASAVKDEGNQLPEGVQKSVMGTAREFSRKGTVLDAKV